MNPKKKAVSPKKVLRKKVSKKKVPKKVLKKKVSKKIIGVQKAPRKPPAHKRVKIEEIVVLTKILSELTQVNLDLSNRVDNLIKLKINNFNNFVGKEVLWELLQDVQRRELPPETNKNKLKKIYDAVKRGLIRYKKADSLDEDAKSTFNELGTILGW